jgi:hypothetical protein
MSQQHLFSPPHRAERDQIRSILQCDQSHDYDEWDEIQKRRFAEAFLNQLSSKRQFDVTNGTSPHSPPPATYSSSSSNMPYIDDELIQRERKKALYRADLQQQIEEQKQRKLQEREERRRRPPSPTPTSAFMAPHLAAKNNQPSVLTSNIKPENIDNSESAEIIKKNPYIGALKRNEKSQDRDVEPTIVDAIYQAEAARLAETKAKLNAYKHQQWKEAEEYRTRKEMQRQQEKIQQAWEDEKTERERMQQQWAYEKEQQRLKVKMQGHPLPTAEDITIRDHINQKESSIVMVDLESRKQQQEHDHIPPPPPPQLEDIGPPPSPLPLPPPSSYNIESKRALELAALLSDALAQHAAEVRSLKTRAERAEVTSTATALKVDALIGEVARMRAADAAAAISAAAAATTIPQSSSQYLPPQPPPLQHTSTTLTNISNNANIIDKRVLPIFQTSVMLAPMINGPINNTTAAPTPLNGCLGYLPTYNESMSNGLRQSFLQQHLTTTTSTAHNIFPIEITTTTAPAAAAAGGGATSIEQGAVWRKEKGRSKKPLTIRAEGSTATWQKVLSVIKRNSNNDSSSSSSGSGINTNEMWKIGAKHHSD